MTVILIVGTYLVYASMGEAAAAIYFIALFFAIQQRSERQR